jgi:hypothetical protein
MVIPIRTAFLQQVTALAGIMRLVDEATRKVNLDNKILAG